MEVINISWFTELFINQAKPALEYHRGLGSGSDDTQMYILLDEDGNEYPAVLVDEETVFDATANDIREGKVAATEDGVTTGTKEIPAYYTWEGFRVIPNGQACKMAMTDYDYTKIQAVFCLFNTNLSDSLASDRVSINDKVYPVLSTDPEADVIKNDEGAYIDFGIINESGKPYLIRYIMYKEMY